jgi:hypothetical protein
MPAPLWLQNVLVVGAGAAVKALRQGLREGAAHALDSVLEDVQGLTRQADRRVRSVRKNIRERRPATEKTTPTEVVEAEIIDEEKE